MDTMRMVFERAAASYNMVFADWLYIHFIPRTMILLLLVWILVYALAQVFQYVIAPLLILFFYHGLLRAWNFLVVESVQELIYIHWYADEKPFLRGFYLRLCDRIQKNRLILAHTRYSGILYKGRVQKVTARLMVIALVLALSWTLAFGLYHEYAANASPKNDQALGVNPPDDTPWPDAALAENPDDDSADDSSEDKPFPHPAEFDGVAGVRFKLSSYGAWGSNVRDLPSVSKGKRLEVLKGSNVVMDYLGEYAIDENNQNVFWLKVKTPSGVVGYISSSLLEVMP